MIEPSLALQTAVGNALVAASEVTDLVPANRIRSGSTRPEHFPTIILSGGQTIFLGNASGSQYLARVYLDLHIWALEDGADTAKAIGFAVCNTLRVAPPAMGFDIDEFSLPAIHWMRDPDPVRSCAHGVLTVEAVVRWKI